MSISKYIQDLENMISLQDGLLKRLSSENAKLREKIAWKPFSTAPVDGRKVLVLFDHKNDTEHTVLISRFISTEGINKWSHGDLNATHWMDIQENA